jgi:hypothetical protein
MFSKNYWIVPVKYKKLYTICVFAASSVELPSRASLAPTGFGEIEIV